MTESFNYQVKNLTIKLNILQIYMTTLSVIATVKTQNCGMWLHCHKVV